MASGWKKMVLNTQERAISNDLNRLQLFKERDVAELFRYMLDVTGNDDLDAGAVVAEPGSIETPLRAEIINGLLVRPQPGSLNLLVDPGVLFLMAPDGAADESSYKYIRDSGYPTAGAPFVMTANGAGTTRIDVLECRVDPTDNSESDNRDIFDPVTGLFSATSVVKERSGRLVYRVRAGTAGSGFASVGTASGWLPLAVASVPAGTTTNDTITFWDVRPLLNDRAPAGPSALSVSKARINNVLMNYSVGLPATGMIDAVSAVASPYGTASRRLGGRLRSGSVVADAESIDLGLAANRDPSLALTVNRPWYLYLVTPFGLPRWARYTASGTRLPRSPRGIPVVASVAPTMNGVPSADVTLPTVTGLGGATQAGVAVFASWADTGPVLAGGFTDGHRTILASTASSGAPIEVTSTSFVNGGSNAIARFDFTPGTHYPPNTREILVEFRADITYTYVSGGGVRQFLRIYGPNGGANQTFMNLSTQGAVPVANTLGGGFGGGDVWALVWIPLPSAYPAAPTSQRLDVYYDVQGDAVTANAASAFARIVGWRTVD